MLTRVLIAFSLLAASSPAAAWWEYGHETVARIAAMNVTAQTRHGIARLIAQNRLLETPTCPLRDIEDASVWPDCIRSMGERFNYTAPWHYQNVDICKPFDQKSACRDGNCVSAQIERNAKLLADEALPKRERLMALSFLIHFVGDLHMPLHAGDKGDLGGNRQPVSYGLIAGRLNLHSAWDGYLAERGISTPPGDGAGILAAFGPAEQSAMQGGTVTDWAKESWELSRTAAYGGILPDPCGPAPQDRPVIDRADIEAAIPVVRRQIARGGLRLARLLDEAFSGRPPAIAEAR